MNLLLQITTRPQTQPYIECYLSEWLPGVKWTLIRQTDDGRSWLLTLLANPCSDPVEKAVNALVLSNWVIAMAFLSSHEQPLPMFR